jgi:hypothetical protein
LDWLEHGSRYAVRGCLTYFGVLLLFLAQRADAQPAPYRAYRTLETTHFRIHAPPELEREGRIVAAAAERAYAQLARELVAPRGIVDVVVSNDADYSNGSATPFPSNRIIIFTHPPLENENLRVQEDWLTLVVTHELAHVFHLDRARGVWGVAQRVFGRAPFLFPNAYAPSWLVEGLAVYYESRLTEGGRLAGSQHRLLARAGARGGHVLRLDELSLGRPGFPGGDATYAYGSLFVDWLSRTYGDTTVPRFVERQSAQLIPYMLNRSAVQGFGVSFGTAFARWRDSVERSVGPESAPLPGWRELTERSVSVPSPRWLNDSTIVYSATNGREINAAYTLTLGGTRTRLGRRDGPGANVPLPDGSLLYSSLDYTAREEVRSDLYRQWPDGRGERLTRGRSLSQPDARRDGTIVAVQAGSNASRLVLLTPDAGVETRLTPMMPGETWSEPRWSPDGARIVTVQRRRDGVSSLVILTRDSSGEWSRGEVDRGRHAFASPSWTPEGDGLVYVSERSGAPQLVRANASPQNVATVPHLLVPDSAGVGIYRPELSPDGRLLAAVALRADGYHVGVSVMHVFAGETAEGPGARRPRADSASARDSAGAFHSYSAFRTLLPRYWYPIIEPAASRGTRLGFITSGGDVIGRHAFTAFAAATTSGEGVTGGLYYRYAGLRQPMLDFVVSQNWESSGVILGQNSARLGTLLERTQSVSLAATFLRPRVRTFTSVSAGVGVERRRWATDPAPLIAQLDPDFSRDYDFPRVFLGAGWANTKRPPLSISPEDGISLSTTARERYRAGAIGTTASLSVVAATSGYKSLDLPGFAHHVLALRVAGGWADRRSSTSLEVGGASGGAVELLPGYTLGEGRRTFGVRGFESAAVYGTRAMAGALEYRAPLALGGRGFGLLPFFFDRSSISAFADAGVATCATDAVYPSICAPPPLIGRTIASAGAELGINAALLDWDRPQPIRIGLAVPVAGREVTGARAATVYLAFGLSF